MFLPEVTVAMFRKTENGRTVLHGAGKRPPVCHPVLPHGFYQVEDLLAIRAGAVLNTGGRLVNFEMLQKGLLGMIALPTGHTVVGTVLDATRLLVHLHGGPTCQMPSTPWTLVDRLPRVHTHMPPKGLGGGKVLSTKGAVDLGFLQLRNGKRHIPSTSTHGECCGHTTFEGEFGTPLDAPQHSFLDDNLIGPQPHKTNWRLT